MLPWLAMPRQRRDHMDECMSLHFRRFSAKFQMPSLRDKSSLQLHGQEA